MTGHAVRARPPRGEVALPRAEEPPETRLVDAAYSPGGHADVFYRPRTEGEVAAILGAHATVLAVGAQSSLTGGATPAGGALVATDRMDAFTIDADARTARCGAGVVLSVLRDAARGRGLFVAPAPTFDGATIGGMASTNAAGAATFKHGTMRAAVLGLTVVLADGSVLDLRRGEVVASDDGWFEVVSPSGVARRVPTPRHRLPDVPKCSAGYFAAPRMDLVDLFVGSEGTLGIVTDVVLRLTPLPPASLVCWLALGDEAAAIEVTRRLRDASRATWRSGDPAGLDVSAIESLDRRCLELLREDGEDRRHGIAVDPSAQAALVFDVGLPGAPTDAEILDQLAQPGRTDAPVARLARLVADVAGGLDGFDAALPGEPAKAGHIFALREAVPTCVNHRVRDARLSDPSVSKVAGDFVVPFERFAESIAAYRRAFSSRGLDHAIWGHVSDGNVHPNVIPRHGRDAAAGREALLDLAAQVVAMGGSPLAEHGVGRSPVKQAMLRLLVGDAGIEGMRAVRRALDPEGRLAPGVLFAP